MLWPSIRGYGIPCGPALVRRPTGRGGRGAGGVSAAVYGGKALRWAGASAPLAAAGDGERLQGCSEKSLAEAADALDAIYKGKLLQAVCILEQAQRKTEEMVIEKDMTWDFP